MTEAEKLSTLKTILGITDTSEDAILTTYLDLSKREILAWRYSYSPNVPARIPTEYESVQLFAVVAGYSIAGAENETMHFENGITRTFKYSDMLSYIRANVIPIVGCG